MDEFTEIYQDQDLYGEQLTYTSPHWQKLQNLIKEKGKLFSLRDVSCKFVPRPHPTYNKRHGKKVRCKPTPLEL